jgi:flagellar motor switch protein FliN/FliY
MVTCRSAQHCRWGPWDKPFDHTVHQVLRLGRGAIIELESSEYDAVSILANNLPVAKGTVVVNGNRIAVEVGELLPRLPDMR